MGRRWRLLYDRQRAYNGHCDDPSTPGKTVRIARRLLHFPRSRMEVLIHEFTHAADWSKDEPWVDRFAADLARLLCAEGFRPKNLTPRRQGAKKGI